MSYKREEINGTTPLDIKKLNDNIRNLWSKVFGDIDMTDMSGATQIAINNKISEGDLSSIIQQSPQDIKIGFNGINDVIDIDNTGLQVNHTDGSYTRMEGSGFKRYVAGQGKTYFSLFQYIPISWNGSKRQTIQLNNEFKGKDFVIMCTLNGVTIGGANSTFSDFSFDYLPATVNKTNGTFDVLWTYTNYDSKTMACSGGIYVFA